MSERNERKELEISTHRWMWAGVILMGLLAGIFPIFRLYEPVQRAEARESQMTFLAARGDELFDGECSACHGAQGLGALAPAVGSRNFLESVEDIQISQLIALGMPGTEMVAYSADYGGPMTSTDIEAITAYLRSLEEESVANPNWRMPLADEDLSGKDLYNLACTRCHGLDRMGIEDVAPDISETSFAMDESDEWLAERIRDGRDEMPRFGGVLTDSQINLLVAFLRGGLVTTTTTVVGDGSVTTTTRPDADDDEVLKLGKLIFDVTGGGKGCAECHAFDAQGTKDGPNIIGSSKSAISGAMGGGVVDMEDIKLTPDELEAVYRYLSTLSP
jgi:mono/diheme cytochrome c family protein